jgi:outer membrane protein assembly factor BamB
MDRDGIYPDTGLLDLWPEGGPELIHTYTDLGDGFSAPAITEAGIFIAGMFDSTGIIKHLNRENGLIWSYSYGKEFTFKYTGARGTPTVEGNRLYYSGTLGDAFCLNALDGSVHWKLNIFDTFGGPHIKWGYCESPLIYEDLVILTPGGPSHNVIALDKYSGELRWSASLDSATNAYNSPFLIRHRDEELVVLNTTGYLVLIHPRTGEVAYKHPIAHPNNNHAISPLYTDGKLFTTTGYGGGAVLYEINEANKRLDTIYYNRDLDSRLSGLLMVDGIVYGTSHRKKQWVGVDLETGQTVFQSRELKPGSFLLADGKFFIFTETGEVALAKPHREGFDVLSRFEIPVGSVQLAFTHPVIYEGTLYIRYRDQLWLFDVNK